MKLILSKDITQKISANLHQLFVTANSFSSKKAIFPVRIHKFSILTHNNFIAQIHISACNDFFGIL